MSENVKTIEQAAAELKGQVQTAATDAANTAVLAVKTTAEAATAEAAKALAENATLATAQAATQKHLDALDIRVKHSYGADNAAGSFLEELKSHGEQLQGRKHGQSVEFTLSTKGANDMLSPAAAPGRVISPVRLPGIIGPPNQITHVRPLIAGGQIGAPSFTYLRESGFIGLPAMTAEGATKPQVGITMQEVVGQVKKVAAYFKMSSELMNDFPSLASYLTGRVDEKIKQVEDVQLLFGDNTGQNLQGISPLAQAINFGTLRATRAGIIDVVRAAAAQVRRSQFRCTDILMNPDDLAALELQKDANGQYLLPTLLTGTLPTIGRVRLVEVDAMTAGSFLAGAFDLGAQVFEREGLTMRFFDQNEDDAITNKVTCVIEERLVQAVYRPEAFVKGTYVAGIAALSAV